MRRTVEQSGFSLIEVMVAMMISGIALIGTLGAVELSTRHVQQGALSSKALELAQGRIEVKRSIQWQLLLKDDLDRDGIPETVMADDGQGPDVSAGDGIYTGSYEHDGIQGVWTIEGDRPGPLSASSMVTIRAVASYPGLRGQRKEVQVATLRANPRYMGQS